jgi:CBS domain-containing protein
LVLTATRLDRQSGVLAAYTGGVLMLISDVLRVKGRKVVKAAASDSVRDAVHSLAENRIGAVVVEDQWMHLAGVFSERDFINAVASNGAAALELRVRDLMSAPIISCRSSDRIDAVLATMTLRKIRHVPVIDGEQLSRIVSIGDLVKHRLDEKELEANVLLDITRMRGQTASASAAELVAHPLASGRAWSRLSTVPVGTVPERKVSSNSDHTHAGAVGSRQIQSASCINSLQWSPGAQLALQG